MEVCRDLVGINSVWQSSDKMSVRKLRGYRAIGARVVGQDAEFRIPKGDAV